MMSRPATCDLVPSTTPGTKRSTWYFGRWHEPLDHGVEAGDGQPVAGQEEGDRRPSRECKRLCAFNASRSLRTRSVAPHTWTVCTLIVRGFG